MAIIVENPILSFGNWRIEGESYEPQDQPLVSISNARLRSVQALLELGLAMPALEGLLRSGRLVPVAATAESKTPAHLTH